jgi:hypothetical protein
MTAPGWPLHSYLALGALPGAVPCARLHARVIVAEWGLTELASIAELIVSELVTNSLRASAGLTDSRYRGHLSPGIPPIRLWLQADREWVLVQVWDASQLLPTRQEPDLEAEQGRGLLLVETLSERWGTYRPEGSSGKVVWALCGMNTGSLSISRARRTGA